MHQELNAFDTLSVGANVFIGREPLRWGPLKLVDEAEIARRTAPLLAQLGAGFPPSARMADLSLAERQLVEIAKALSLSARLLILDEPTSSLTTTETERLLALVETLRAEGVAVILISHRLGEVERLADRVLVLRDGRLVAELPRAEVSAAAMIRHMIGRDLKTLHTPPAAPPGPPVLDVQDVRTTHRPDRPVSLTVRRGEILGLAGLIGSGRTELARTLFGLDPLLGGTVRIDGRPVSIDGPRAAIAAGLYLVPEDRKRSGLVLDFSIRDNVTLPNLRAHARRWLVDTGSEEAEAQRQRARLDIRAESTRLPCSALSGGNQQKVVLAKWLSMSPRVVIFDEPTRGVDVGAKSEIYRRMRELADAGIGILMISSDMEEIVGVSDRVAVMHEGASPASSTETPSANAPSCRSPSAAAPSETPEDPDTAMFTRNDLSLLILILVVGAAVAAINPRFLSPINLSNTANLIGLFGLFSVAQAFVIISGGIELSAGSVIALLGVVFVDLVASGTLPPGAAFVLVIALGAAIGLVHGVLIARVGLQPFIVTLCGLLIYRGIARWTTEDATAGFPFGASYPWLEWLTTGRFYGVPHSLIVFLAVTAVMAVVLHRSVFGRHLFAVGRNEEAARYSGIDTRKVVIAAYVIASALTALAAVFIAMYTRSISPSSHGNFYELYAIAAAVLGGCSLRGGQGSIAGVVLGTVLLQVLQNLVNLLGVPSSLNFAVMGSVILLGVLVDRRFQIHGEGRAGRRARETAVVGAPAAGRSPRP